MCYYNWEHTCIQLLIIVIALHSFSCIPFSGVHWCYVLFDKITSFCTFRLLEDDVCISLVHASFSTNATPHTIMTYLYLPCHWYCHWPSTHLLVHSSLDSEVNIRNSAAAHLACSHEVPTETSDCNVFGTKGYAGSAVRCIVNQWKLTWLHFHCKRCFQTSCIVKVWTRSENQTKSRAFNWLSARDLSTISHLTSACTTTPSHPTV